MKSFTKKLALVLSLAMVVTLVAPAVTAKADAKYTCTYAEQDKKDALTSYKLEKVGDTVDLKVRGLAGDWTKGYTGWKSSNPAVATVDDRNGLVTAVSQGTAEISVGLSSDYAIGTVTVQVGADVTIGLADKSVRNLTEQTLIVGGTADLSFFGVANYTKNNFTVTWKSADEKVATVDTTGLVTAVAEGTTEVSVVVVNNKTGAKFEPTAVKVVVKADKKLTATQVSTTKATLTFADESIKTLDINKLHMIYLVANKYEITVPMKSAKYVEATKSFDVESYMTFTDKVVYKFVYGDQEGEFVASNGKVTSMKLTYDASKAYINRDIYLEATLYDENGIDVTAVNNLINGSIEYALVEESSEGHFWLQADAQGYSIFFNTPDVALAKATYFNAAGDAVCEAPVLSVYAQKAEEIVPSLDYSAGIIAYSTTTDWKNVSHRIVLGDTDQKLYVQMKDNKGAIVSNDPAVDKSTIVDPDFVFQSTNLDYVSAAADGTLTAGNEVDNVAVLVYHVVVTTDGEQKTPVGLCMIQVGKERTASKLVLDVPSVTVNTTDQRDKVAKVTATLSDQYGSNTADCVANKTLTIKVTNSTPKNQAGEEALQNHLAAVYNNGKYEIVVDGTADPEYITGTSTQTQYTVQVSYGDNANCKKTFTVICRKPGATSNAYRVEVGDPVDVSTKNGAQKANIYLVGLSNSVILDTLNIKAAKPAKASDMLVGDYYFTITKDGNAVKTATVKTDNDGFKYVELPLSSVVVDGGKNIVKAEPTGSYYVTIYTGIGKDGAGTTASASSSVKSNTITVKKSDPVLRYVGREELTIDLSNFDLTSDDGRKAAFAAALQDNFKFTLDNKETELGDPKFHIDTEASTFRYSNDYKNLYLYTAVVYYQVNTADDLWVKYGNVAINSRVEVK